MVRTAAFWRDGWRCTACGRAGRLETHHEPPLRTEDPDADPDDLDGSRTLCRDCHIERHRADGMTPGRDEWRAFVGSLSR